MLDVAFWYEYRRRADLLIWLAFLNPALVSAYALVAHQGRAALEIWLLGLGMNFILCMVVAIGTYIATRITISRGVATVQREKMWLDIIRRGPFMRVVEPRPEAR